jgi:hypothetical protein
MSDYPDALECDKLTAVAGDSNLIGQFIDFLVEEKGFAICELRSYSYGGRNIEDWAPAKVQPHELLAEFFDIDLDKVEEERRAILDFLASQHEGKDAEVNVIVDGEDLDAE